MGAIAELFRDHGDDYIQQFKHGIPSAHLKAIYQIQNCRTSTQGINIYRCSDCAKTHYVYRGCGSRNCPNCQQHKASEWLRCRLQERLPGPHFMITFTIPKELRQHFRANQRDTYTALFAASSQALRELAANPRFIGADLPGFFGVLHTWGRQLQYHPHIHYIVPGGGVDKKSKLWKASRTGYFVSQKALSKLFRGKLKAALHERHLLTGIDVAVWSRDFVVNIQAVGDSPEGALKYLAPYVFKAAISDSRIISVSDGQVTFSYKKSGSNRYRKMTLDVGEFMRRFLQHILPKGFMKIRYFGFMGPGSSFNTQQVTLMIEVAYEFKLVFEPAGCEMTKPWKPVCCKCGGKLQLMQVILPHQILSG
ncbi:MAG: transposase [Candidatus Fermentibacteria bacterium]|nr:transposase [Candidatus Fermentibacteria bacterium]